MHANSAPMKRNIIFIAALLFTSFSCSHSYDSDKLDLAFYQWNKWEDVNDSGEKPGQQAAPSIGWEDFHRGVGSLVRIPSEIDPGAGVIWYHCRFTLPEEWEGREIELYFEGAGPLVDLYLNEKYVSTHQPEGEPFTAKVTAAIYYTRDNHLSVRVTRDSSNTTRETAGITGKIWVQSDDPHMHIEEMNP